jgi:hypothetical protein
LVTWPSWVAADDCRAAEKRHELAALHSLAEVIAAVQSWHPGGKLTKAQITRRSPSLAGYVQEALTGMRPEMVAEMTATRQLLVQDGRFDSAQLIYWSRVYTLEPREGTVFLRVVARHVTDKPGLAPSRWTVSVKRRCASSTSGSSGLALKPARAATSSSQAA